MDVLDRLSVDLRHLVKQLLPPLLQESLLPLLGLIWKQEEEDVVSHLDQGLVVERTALTFMEGFAVD